MSVGAHMHPPPVMRSEIVAEGPSSARRQRKSRRALAVIVVVVALCFKIAEDGLRIFDRSSPISSMT